MESKRMADLGIPPKAGPQLDSRVWEAQQKAIEESTRATQEFGKEAMKAAFLVNGGGAAATIAFLGQIAQKCPLWLKLWAPVLESFASGLIAAVVALGASYISQALFTYGAASRDFATRARAPTTAWGLVAQVTAACLFLLSCGYFVRALLKASDAFGSQLPECGL